MVETLDDFMADWAAIRKQSPIRIVSSRGTDLDSQFDIACEKTIFDLIQKTDAHAQVTRELLATLVAEGVKSFMTHWRDTLRQQDLSGLIEVVLETQNLSPIELRSFMSALPDSLLTRVASSAIGSAKGVHSLVAVEAAFRAKKISGYTIGNENGRIFAEFPEGDSVVKFFLDESIDLL